MPAVAEYHVCTIGLAPQPCPSCGTVNDQAECGICGFSHATPEARVVACSPPPDEVLPTGYKISCFQSDRCLCGTVKIVIESTLQCPECGENERPQLKPIEVNSKGLPEPAIVQPTCARCAKFNENAAYGDMKDITQFEIRVGEFFCIECGTSAGPVKFVETATEPIVQTHPPQSPAASVPPRRGKRGR